MKRQRKFWLGLILGMFVVVAVSGWQRLYGWWDGRGDLKIGVIGKRGVALVSISPERKMINQLRVENGTQLWVPRGYGWYGADKIQKLLIQEKKRDLSRELIFYNLGNVVDRVVWVDEIDDWSKPEKWGWELGWINWFKYKSMEASMLVKTESIEEELLKKPDLGETLLRDMADSRIVEEGYRVTIYNASTKLGMAAWLGERLEWWGLTVEGWESWDKPIEGNCILKYRGREGKAKEPLSVIQLKSLLNCRVETDSQIDQTKMEIYVGEGWGEVLKYPSYVRTFEVGQH